MIGRLPFGLVCDDRVFSHDIGLTQRALRDGTPLDDGIEPHASVRITRRILALLTASGFAAACTMLPAREASPADLEAFHTRDYVAAVRRMSLDGGGQAGEAAPVGAGSFLAASVAAGGCLAAIEAVLAGRVSAAYVLARPPGHHALAGSGMGYCLFNNVVLAARRAQDLGAKRVMIVDWDVHHGNGTQGAFYDDPSVLFLSLHQDNWYPLDMGLLAQQGAGAGLGTTINVPLPAGTGDRGYAEAWSLIVVPAAQRFGPDVILISAGQDPAMFDPLGRMMLTMQGFRSLGRAARALADELCGGRLLLVQEGGYSAAYTPFATLGALEGASGLLTGVPDPYEGTSELWRAQAIWTDETRQAVRYAAEARTEVPRA